MAGAQTVGQIVINELFFAVTDWMHCLMMHSLCQQRKVGLLEPESQSRVFLPAHKTDRPFEVFLPILIHLRLSSGIHTILRQQKWFHHIILTPEACSGVGHTLLPDSVIS